MMVEFLTDNTAVVHALTKCTAQDPHLSHFLHCLFFLEVTCRFEHRVSTSQGSRMWVQMCCPVTTCQFSCLSSRRPPQQLPSPHPSWSCCSTTIAIGPQVLISQFFSRGLAPSTQGTFASAKHNYLTFCLKHNLPPIPASQHTTYLFAAHLAREGLCPSVVNCDLIIKYVLFCFWYM